MPRTRKRTTAPATEGQVIQRWRKKKKYAIYRPLRAPVPFKMATKLKYSTGVNVNAAGGRTVGVHVYSANGVYDPDITAVGHQPRGFDQLISLYDHMVVIYSEIDVIFYPSDNIEQLGWVAARDFTTVGASIDDYLELSNCKHISLCNSNLGYANRIKMSINPNVYLTRSKPLSDPNLKNSNSSNPTEQVYWHVGVGTTSVSDPAPVRIEVVLTYSVVCIEPKDPGIS